MHTKEDTTISCSLFQTQERTIRGITDKINRAEEIQQKAAPALELQKEVDVILDCPDYDAAQLDCINCRFIAHFRKKTAALITKAQKLA